MAEIEKVFVLVTRLIKKERCDQGDDESYAGYLTDEQGNYVPSPRIGKSLIVGGDDESAGSFSFSTENIIAILICQDGWKVMTENSAYDVKSKRQYH